MEAAGVEPASENHQPMGLHAYSIRTAPHRNRMDKATTGSTRNFLTCKTTTLQSRMAISSVLTPDTQAMSNSSAG